MLIERTERMGTELHAMNAKLDAMVSSNERRLTTLQDRVVALEMRWAERHGSNKMAAMVVGGAATAGGILASFLTKFWPG